MSYLGHLREIGASTAGRAVTHTLYVSPNGSNTNGLTFATAYTTIQAALDAASTDTDDCTLILISPHTSHYNIDTTGDPTWSANVILQGTHRTWAKIENTHTSATSIMKLTGRASVIDLNFNLGSSSDNGLIMTHGGFRAYHCQFIGEDLTGAATALEVVGASAIKHGKVVDCHFLGEGTTHMTAIKLDKVAFSLFERIQIHKCKTGIQIVDETSDDNTFRTIDIGESGIGFDIDEGNEQHVMGAILHGNTTNIDDEVGDHVYNNIDGNFPVTTVPDDFTGVTVATGNGLDTWTVANVTVRAAATKPFRITGVHVEASATEKFRVRLTGDGGSIYFADFQIEGEANANKRESISLPSGTEFIFNKGAVIEASSKSESDGVDNAIIWLEIQEI